MKRCIDCGQGLADDARRCDKCMTIQPNHNPRGRRIGTPYLVIRWALLTLLVAVAWGILGFEADETIWFSIMEFGLAAAIIMIIDYFLFQKVVVLMTSIHAQLMSFLR
jgi:predicted nucleic acid-binding Zn ribbon protein